MLYLFILSPIGLMLSIISSFIAEALDYLKDIDSGMISYFIEDSLNDSFMD